MVEGAVPLLQPIFFRGAFWLANAIRTARRRLASGKTQPHCNELELSYLGLTDVFGDVEMGKSLGSGLVEMGAF